MRRFAILTLILCGLGCSSDKQEVQNSRSSWLPEQFLTDSTPDFFHNTGDAPQK